MKRNKERIIPIMLLSILLISACGAQPIVQPATEPISYDTSPSPYSLGIAYMPALLLNDAELEVEQRFQFNNENFSMQTEYSITNNTHEVQTAELGFVERLNPATLEYDKTTRILLDGNPVETDLFYYGKWDDGIIYDTTYQKAVTQYRQYFDNYSVLDFIAELKNYKDVETAPPFNGEPCTLYTFDLKAEGDSYFYFDLSFDREKTKIMADRGEV